MTDRSKANLANSKSYYANHEANKARVRGYYHKNRDRHRDADLRRTFGITLEDYDVMLAAQEGGCKICGKVCKTGRRLAVDHDHETGKVLGLLCYSCNMKLGWFESHADEVLKYLTYNS